MKRKVSRNDANSGKWPYLWLTKTAALALLGLLALAIPAKAGTVELEALPLGNVPVVETFALGGGGQTTPNGPTFWYTVTTVNAKGFQSVQPTAISATFLAGKNTANVTWTAAVVQADGTAIAGYNVWRGNSSIGPFTQINTALVTGTSFSDSFQLPNAPSGLSVTVP